MEGNQPELSRQDCALVVEALAQWAGNPRATETYREDRAWELIELIAWELDEQPSNMVEDIDPIWDSGY